jgi:hypothetical protein
MANNAFENGRTQASLRTLRALFSAVVEAVENSNREKSDGHSRKPTS